jgi:hypothetical protein
VRDFSRRLTFLPEERIHIPFLIGQILQGRFEALRTAAVWILSCRMFQSGGQASLEMLTAPCTQGRKNSFDERVIFPI